MLQLLIRRRGRYEEAMSVSGGKSTDNTGAGDGGVDDGDDVLKLRLEDGVEVGGGGEGGKAVTGGGGRRKGL